MADEHLVRRHLDREADVESGSLAARRVEPDLTAEADDHRLAEGEAEADAARVAGGRPVRAWPVSRRLLVAVASPSDALEHREERLLGLGRHADAVVGDRETQLVVAVAEACVDVDLPALVRELDGVHDQVLHDRCDPHVVKEEHLILDLLVEPDVDLNVLLLRLERDDAEQVDEAGAQLGSLRPHLEVAVLDQVQVDQVVDQAEHLPGRDQVDLEQLGLLRGQVGPAELLRGEQDGVERCLDLVRDRRVEELVDVAQQHLLVDLDLLRRLLEHDDLRVALLEAAVLRLDLEEAILATQLDPVALVCLLDERLERDLVAGLPRRLGLLLDRGGS